MKNARVNRQNIDLIYRRLNGIESESQRQWGSLTPAGLMRHLRHLVEMSLGEIEPADRSNFLTRSVVRYLFFHVITRWPKGIKAPSSLTPDAGELAEEREKLFAALDRFVAESESKPTRKTVHTVFGPTTLDYWQHLHGVHFHHHFRQFGVDR